LPGVYLWRFSWIRPDVVEPLQNVPPKVDLEAAEVGGQLLVRFRRDQHGGHRGFAQQPRQRTTGAVSSRVE
jgi:hypothetical protein